MDGSCFIVTPNVNLKLQAATTSVSVSHGDQENRDWSGRAASVSSYKLQYEAKFPCKTRQELHVCWS